MALTEERTRELATHAAPSNEDAIPRRTAFGLLAAWAVLFPVAIALEPAAAADGQPWWGVPAGAALFGALGATITGLAQRKTWGIGASIAASSLFTVGVFACPATGHHAMGLWWFGELAAAAVLVAMSARAYLRRAG